MLETRTWDAAVILLRLTILPSTSARLSKTGILDILSMRSVSWQGLKGCLRLRLPRD